MNHQSDLQVKVRLADWSKENAVLRSIREQVFIIEQSVPREIEWDNMDEASQHFLVLDKHDQAIACARLQSNGQFGRMAVIKAWRKRGIGLLLLNKILDYAKDKNLKVHCHAQVQAIPFYLKAGFICVGERYLEADIEHQNMEYQH